MTKRTITVELTVAEFNTIFGDLSYMQDHAELVKPSRVSARRKLNTAWNAHNPKVHASQEATDERRTHKRREPRPPGHADQTGVSGQQP